jgi:anti-sigma factor RsiW
MSMHPIDEDDLHAFVDQALDARRHAEVAAYLDGNPDIATRVARYRKEADMLRAALAPIAEEPVPPELDLTRIIADRRRRGAMFQWAAAAVVLVCLGGLGGWSLRGIGEAPGAGLQALALEAADSYSVFAPDRAHAVEMAASDREELLQWISQRLGRKVAVPDLSAAGYRFLGGRVVATAHGPAALFLYDDGRGGRLAVLSRPMAVDKDAPMAPLARGTVHGYAWSQNGLGYSLVGEAPADMLHPIADDVRRQVSHAT